MNMYIHISFRTYTCKKYAHINQQNSATLPLYNYIIVFIVARNVINYQIVSSLFVGMLINRKSFLNSFLHFFRSPMSNLGEVVAMFFTQILVCACSTLYNQNNCIFQNPGEQKLTARVDISPHLEAIL